MNHLERVWLVTLIASWSLLAGHAAVAAGRWQERDFPPPNAGHLVFIIMSDGNPACATYDGSNCLWGVAMGSIDFSKVKPLVCGAAHRRLYGVTGFEDPNHWCNLALKSGSASPTRPDQPAPAAPPPASSYRVTDWSSWGRDKGIEYRYRIGWNPASGGPGQTINVDYEVRNPGRQRWVGSVRSADCASGSLWGSTDVTLDPGQTKGTRVNAPNCGTAANPSVKPAIGGAPKTY
jgi:hypothetical protein